jgi:hypothetical protein
MELLSIPERSNRPSIVGCPNVQNISLITHLSHKHLGYSYTMLPLMLHEPFVDISCIGNIKIDLKELSLCEIEVLTAMRMTMSWVVTPYRLVGRYQHFGETYCLHLQG